MLIPRHAEDETGTMLGEIRSGLVNLGFHGDGAFPPVQAALDRVGDADLQSAFLAAKAKGKRRVRQEGWDVVTVAQTLVQGRERWFRVRMHPAASRAHRVTPSLSSKPSFRARSSPAPARESLPRRERCTQGLQRRDECRWGNIASRAKQRPGCKRPGVCCQLGHPLAE